MKTNGEQVVNLEDGFIELKNCFKQIPVPFKVYADFEYILKKFKNSEGYYTQKYRENKSCSFSYKLVCVYNKFSKTIVVYSGENVAYRLIE